MDHASAFDESAKPVHIMPEFRKLVVAVAVIAGVTADVSLLVAEDILEPDGRVVLHQTRAQLRGKAESLLEILLVRESVLTYLDLDYEGEWL